MLLSRALPRKTGARVSGVGRRQLGKVGDGRREEELRRRERREEKGKFKMRGFLQSDVGERAEGGGGTPTPDLVLVI